MPLLLSDLIGIQHHTRLISTRQKIRKFPSVSGVEPLVNENQSWGLKGGVLYPEVMKNIITVCLFIVKICFRMRLSITV